MKLQELPDDLLNMIHSIAKTAHACECIQAAYRRFLARKIAVREMLSNLRQYEDCPGTTIDKMILFCADVLTGKEKDHKWLSEKIGRLGAMAWYNSYSRRQWQWSISDVRYLRLATLFEAPEWDDIDEDYLTAFAMDAD